ncbi:uncharacterized protein LOC143647353 [Tamandua tetradactyla]|uniref:uncharacterized protein LOC143647353 n=1 Tax=Tamandua tetradactyla TaxID=48850 RepID=UPI0040546809
MCLILRELVSSLSFILWIFFLPLKHNTAPSCQPLLIWLDGHEEMVSLDLRAQEAEVPLKLHRQYRYPEDTPFTKATKKSLVRGTPASLRSLMVSGFCSAGQRGSLKQMCICLMLRQSSWDFFKKICHAVSCPLERRGTEQGL